MMDEIEDMVMVKSISNRNTAKLSKNQFLSYSNYDWSLFLSQFSILKEIIHQASTINQTRIMHLKQEIASGRYQINSELIAMKLIADL
ncbi:flagellar biosynthesis anti-sigma factor FlgM [Legionella beliardensis]|uniref:Flagellar biosynthesis anti-sigma factor FlgM n=1 Tax=Legionella beliardensis TaxID=91822 RepID=A0A378IAD8_9GAMM|nr:flagellar biosynthesis anti-sigma factor FlgM [Legionella beliardensis]STX29304.1 flagellar biosynthesis anti-sigma factor FlgM [Legionella beliardensis]